MSNLKTIYENHTYYEDLPFEEDAPSAAEFTRSVYKSVENNFNKTLDSLQSNINDEFTEVDKRIKYLERCESTFKDKYISLLESKETKNTTVKKEEESVEGNEVHGLKELVLSLQKRVQMLEEKRPVYHAYSCCFSDLARIQVDKQIYRLDSNLPIKLPENTIFIRLKVVAILGNATSSNGHLYAKIFLRQTGSDSKQGTTDCQYIQHFQSYANLFSHYFTIPWDMKGIQRLNIYMDNCMCDGYYDSLENSNAFEVILLGAFSF